MELHPQPFDLAAQLGVLGGERIGLGSPLLGAETFQDALVALAAPGREVGRVQALPAQERPTLRGVGARVGFVHDAALVLGAELTALRLGPDFWVGHGGFGVHRYIWDCRLRHR